MDVCRFHAELTLISRKRRLQWGTLEYNITLSGHLGIFFLTIEASTFKALDGKRMFWNVLKNKTKCKGLGECAPSNADVLHMGLACITVTPTYSSAIHVVNGMPRCYKQAD
jgi:hypothetical protein